MGRGLGIGDFRVRGEVPPCRGEDDRTGDSALPLPLPLPPANVTAVAAVPAAAARAAAALAPAAAAAAPPLRGSVCDGPNSLSTSCRCRSPFNSSKRSFAACISRHREERVLTATASSSSRSACTRAIACVRAAAASASAATAAGGSGRRVEERRDRGGKFSISTVGRGVKRGEKDAAGAWVRAAAAADAALVAAMDAASLSSNAMAACCRSWCEGTSCGDGTTPASSASYGVRGW